MSDRFRPLSMEQLTAWIFTELAGRGSLFGIPQQTFFRPREDDRFRRQSHGIRLETPFGVAAGPHSQMAQNLLVAWACGARFLELKTVQTLDELEVHKPCIDLEDEGYNVEWSQELRVHESFDEYLRAWILIHALHHKLAFPGEGPGIVFNMSVGYDLAGILAPNMQWYLDVMQDSSAYKDRYREIVARWCPEAGEIEVPDRLSSSVTLSTMHGCPPDEIEKICTYLLAERGLHTSVKCNPTLLGRERVREILHQDLGYRDVTVPDRAFEHDLQYGDAVPMIRRLKELAAARGLVFGVKLSNTLEVENFRQVFPRDDTMYMSGRALHALTANLASRLAEEFSGDLLISFAGGADCFNVSDLLAAGMSTVTVCSDLLKSGGYMRMLQYVENLNAALDAADAGSLEDLAVARAIAAGDSQDPDVTVTEAALANLRRYAEETRSAWALRKDSFRTDRSKTSRALGLFDCIEAPCTDECPVDQKVPQYMNAVRQGDFAGAVAITREDNPLSAILGRVCDHLCENTCIRTHYDEPLAIRDVKRFIMSQEKTAEPRAVATATGHKVAILGAGPAGLAAAEVLAQAGVAVTIFEKYPYAGGMVGGAIPTYRLPQATIDQDLSILERLGVSIQYASEAGVDFDLADLRAAGFEQVFVAVGAQIAKRLGLPGEASEGVLDALRFLRSVREDRPVGIGRQVAVVGAGDTAMDCARSAVRLGAEVKIVYRRTIDQMPADREEIRSALEEGVEVVELATPSALRIREGRLSALVCRRMEYRGDRDASGRKIPHEVPDSDFEIPLETLIVAISQNALLDFFADARPELNERGFLRVDPDTQETTVPGVFAGGDVAEEGPSSIVKAAADGKRAATGMLARLAGPSSISRSADEPADLVSLLSRRARRQWRVPVRHTPLEERRSFAETVLTYSPAEAMAEAERCLDCHQFCSLCVSVCPNLALLTYESVPLAIDVPRLQLNAGELRVVASGELAARQHYQIAVLTDFCNECGNCTTFCPTAGEPYRDKPRLYLHRADFEAESDNAFMLLDQGETAVIEARWQGETHRLEAGREILYQSPALHARIDPRGFELLEVTPGEFLLEGEETDLCAAATMYQVLHNLTRSQPHLPRAEPAGPLTSATRVTHPEYEE